MSSSTLLIFYVVVFQISNCSIYAVNTRLTSVYRSFATKPAKLWTYVNSKVYWLLNSIALTPCLFSHKQFVSIFWLLGFLQTLYTIMPASSCSFLVSIARLVYMLVIFTKHWAKRGRKILHQADCKKLWIVPLYMPSDPSLHFLYQDLWTWKLSHWDSSSLFCILCSPQR